jgi:hypothetical protein
VHFGRALVSLLLACLVPLLLAAQSNSIPEWCRALPRPEYKALQRVLESDPWFEVYKAAPGVFAIYEPHQAEEVISYLIVGHKQAVLFDTGMGIANIHRVTTQLTSRPVVVVNSHTHDDHVGGNWQFAFVYGMDTEFTRTMRVVRAKTPRRKSRRIRSAAICPRDSMPGLTSQNPGKFRERLVTTSRLISAAVRWKFFRCRVTHRTPSRYSTERTDCFSRATRIIPLRSGSFGRKRISMRTSRQ